MKDFAATRAAIVAAYVAGLPTNIICEENHVCYMTLMRAVKAAGVPRRKEGRPPKEKPVPFSQRPVAETPCGCGQGCGLMILRVKGQTRRIWAKGCPFMVERLAKQKLAYEKKRKALIKSQDPMGLRRKRGATGARAPGPAHVATHWCGECGGLPHRRPMSGRCACGEFFEQDAYQTLSGRIVMVAP